MGGLNQLALGVVLFGGVLVGSSSGQFVAPEGSDFHNGTSLILEDDGRGSEWLVRLEQALALSDKEGVVTVMRGLRNLRETRLVPFGPRTHVPVIDRAAGLIVSFGEGPVLEAVLADARAAIASALQRRDLATLMDHATRARALDSWRDAAWAGARLQFEEGRWWEAASLAQVLPTSAGVAALLAAAQAQLPVAEAPPTGGPWERSIMTLRLPEDRYQYAEALPLVIDGRGDEVLVLDHQGLQGLDLDADGLFIEFTTERFDWGIEFLGEERFGLGLPAPRRFVAARRGQRLVLPFNVAIEGWRNPRGRREARLFAVDLGEVTDPPTMPRVAWSARAESPVSSVFGTPVIAGERVFVPVARGGLQVEVSLAAYALDDGRLLFETPLVRGSQPLRFASRRAEIDVELVDKRAREGTLAVHQGVVYVCTGFGVFAAVDGLTGTLRHTFRYDRVFAQDQSAFDSAFLFDSGAWDHEPVRLHGERLVIAPSDSRFLYMLALEPGAEGHLIREDPIERLDRRDVVALVDDPQGGEAPLVVATRRRDNLSSLVLLDSNGHTLATSAALPAGEHQTGRPLVLGGAVVLPTARGLRLFALHDLQRPPVLVPQPADMPPPTEVYGTRGGLLSLHPRDGGELLAIYRRRAR